MSKRVVIYHIPVYFFALIGLITSILLVSLPKSNRSTVSLPDGEVVYTGLDDALTIGALQNDLSEVISEQIPEIQKLIGRKDSPRQSAIWLYISPEKDIPNTVVYLDFIFPCPVCSRNDVFDICRLNLVYDSSFGDFLAQGLFWRESINLKDYLIPQGSYDSRE